MFVPLTCAVIAFNLLEEEQNVNKFIKHLIIAGCIFSLIAAYQLFFGGARLDNDRLRAAASFSNPNGLAIFLVMIISPALYAIKNNIYSKKTGVLTILIIMIGILCTGSRKGIITMCLSVVLFFLFNKKFKLLIVSRVLVVFINILFISYTTLSSRFASNEMKDELEARWGVVSICQEMFFDSPFLGLGYNGFSDNLKKYVPTATRNMKPHNEYVDHITSYGILGTMPFLMIFFYPLYNSYCVLYKQDKRDYSNLEKDISIICSIVVIPFMISSWFAGGLFSQWPIINLLYSIIACSLAVLKKSHTINES
ncbi:MAG: O-antigen ligase family protein [Desulfamplus sp.]|nr:O-antigen ligase family protein [Desulfamplus sp.]